MPGTARGSNAAGMGTAGPRRGMETHHKKGRGKRSGCGCHRNAGGEGGRGKTSDLGLELCPLAALREGCMPERTSQGCGGTRGLGADPTSRHATQHSTSNLPKRSISETPTRNLNLPESSEIWRQLSGNAQSSHPEYFNGWCFARPLRFTWAVLLTAGPGDRTASVRPCCQAPPPRASSPICPEDFFCAIRTFQRILLSPPAPTPPFFWVAL